METIIFIIRIVLSGLLFTFLIIKIYYSLISDKQIDDLIIEHFKKLNFNINEITSLNLTEKVKYGVPINFIFRFYGFIYSFFSLKVKHFRKVELKDKNGKEYTKYIELTLKKRVLISCNEFDSYEI